MKKLIIIALAMGVTTSLFAQGSVNFSSVIGSGVTGRVYTNDLVHPTGLAQGSITPYHVGLYWGVTGSTEAQLVQILSGVATTAAGKFSIGIATTPAATPGGANAVFEVKTWTGNYSSYEAALAAYGSGAKLSDGSSLMFGVSGTFINSTASTSDPAPPPSALTGFSSQIILMPPGPEPSTLALGGLGAVVLLLFRRRK